MTNTARLTISGAALCLFSATGRSRPSCKALYRADMFFATCAGRLDALAIHGRTISKADYNEIKRFADDFKMMMDTVLPDAEAEGVPKG